MNKEELLTKVVEKYNENLLKHRLATKSIDAILYGSRRRAYADVISMMTGLSSKEIFEKFSKYTPSEFEAMRKQNKG